MGGGLMQLATLGKHDDYIMGNPQITFFKSIYRRHTNFAIESVQQIITGSYVTEDTSTYGDVTISKSADLLNNIYLKCPQTIQGINGSELIKNIELIIGGNLIDKHSNEWMKVWSELTTPISKAAGYKYMTGGYNSTNIPKTGQSSIIVPLYFWFCRYLGLSIPLISLQYHDIKLKIEWGNNSSINRDKDSSRSSTCELWCDFIYLDQDERKRFASAKHEYLIEQLQIVDTSISSPARKYKMNSINHPIKEIIWVEGNTGVNEITSETFTITMNGIERFQERDKEYFTLKQPYDHHESIPGYNIKEYDNCIMLSEHLSIGTIDLNTPNTYVLNTTDITNGVIKIATNNGVIPKKGDIILVKETGAGSSTQAGPVITTITNVNTTGTEITLSSNDINIGSDFHLHILSRKSNPQSRCSDYSKNIYVYSFSINPEDHQPSGTCNFSKVNDIKLVISASKVIDKIYALNYNILRLSNGLSSLIYTH